MYLGQNHGANQAHRDKHLGVARTKRRYKH